MGVSRMSHEALDAGTDMSGGRSATTRQGLILLLAAVMPPMAIITLVPNMPLYMREFGAVEGAGFLVAMMLTIPALCVALFSPLAGWLSDRVGRKNLLVGALILYAAVGVIPYFLSDLMQIIGARIGLGITEAVIMTISTALIGDYFSGKERERWVALQIATVSLSAIVLSFAGGLLGELLGSRGPFLIYLLAIPVALAAALVLFEPGRSEKSDTEKRAKLPLGRILPLLFITLFVAILFYTMIIKSSEILGLTATLSSLQLGIILALANIGVALGSFGFGRFKGASGPTLILTGLGLSALGYFGTGLAVTLTVTVVAMVLACVGFGMLLPTMLTWVLKVLPENVRGRGTGLWTGTFFFGQFIAPVLAVPLAAKLGGLAMLLFLFAALSGVAAMLAMLKRKGAPSLLID